ncbi:LysR family transcriptional regulator [Deinococcus radiotolerans]|uniref:HTH lysR-type domain-containing protein n=1 Tax=Deinococcus radiotolerans TaxID=1309407 RepID=A0ABQ2FKX5_9DEIO|nr:LysR family transcriptional regulator [Deinococcus radiotolerans]GGL08184.1 hypothetical protein GCM10010844_28690 [Deinococcus radiotolerans]
MDPSALWLNEHSPLLRTPLTALLVVAEVGSFSDAAERLGMAQSTLSYAVRQAEEALGVVIFERGRHGARLTPAGQAVMVQARHAALAVQAMHLSANGQLSGTLRIASCRSVLRHLITPALQPFSARYPQVNVELTDTRGEHDEVAHLVSSGQVHLGLGRLPMPASLVTTPVLGDEYLLVSAANSAPMRTWDDLQAARFIVCEEDCAPHVAAHIARHATAPVPAVRLHDANVALGMVAAGQGYTILSRLVVTPLLRGLRTTPLPVPLWRTTGLVTTPAGAQHPLVTAFQDQVLHPEGLRTRLGPLARLLTIPERLTARVPVP